MPEDAPRDGNFVPAALFQIDGEARGQLMAGQIDQNTGRILVDQPGGTGTVTSFSFTDANGFAGVVTNPTTTPNLTISTTITGILKGNGTAISAASSSTDYAAVAFKTISVSGQSDVVADSPIDTLTLVGSGITITTDATTDTITFTGAAASLVVGSTTISGGSNTRILYDNAGVLGEYTITGSGTVVVMQNTPTITTPVINGTSSGTGVASAATASTLALRNSSANIFFNNYLGNATATASAGGTTVLTVASSRFQSLTGSSAQTYQLPDATTLSLGPWFVFNNNSSQSLTITNAGGSTLYTVPAGGIIECGPSNIGSANGAWDFHGFYPSTVTWSSGVSGLIFNTALTTSPQIASGASSATSPSFIPQRGASTTGFGGDGTNLHAIVGGATSTTFNSTGLSVGTSGVVTTGTIELGAASDTTLSRSAAGVLAVEGVVIPSISSTNTITNKRNQPRTASSTTASTLTPDLSSANVYFRTTQTASLTINAPTGTPVIGEVIAIYVDAAGAQTLTVDAAFVPFGAAFPASLTAGKTFMLVAQYNGTNWKTTWANAV